MIRALAASVALAWSGAAIAQTPVTVIGSVTPGNCAAFNSITVLKDAGVICGGGGGGSVNGPGPPTVIGDLATWNNTLGTLIKDAGGSTVTGNYTWSGNQTFNGILNQTRAAPVFTLQDTGTAAAALRAFGGGGANGAYFYQNGSTTTIGVAGALDAGIWDNEGTNGRVVLGAGAGGATLFVYPSGGTYIGATPVDPGANNLTVQGTTTSPNFLGGTAAGSGFTLKTTSNGSPSGDIGTIGGDTINIVALSGTGTVNVGSASHGINQLCLFNSVGACDQLVPATGASPGAQMLPSGNTTLAGLSIADQTVAGGANVTTLGLTTGNVTIDCGARPLQSITTATSAWTITAPANDGSCALLVTNGASAVIPTFSGFSVGGNTGSTLTTTNGSKFTITIWRIAGTSGYTIFAHQ